ncbi:MAG: hypothetical protein KC620_23650, partial [Myxococcales bacterium]|nr:hypothetical protein [Myxococcales bacterium]
YYTPEEFVRRDPETGTIRLRDGQRAIRVGEDFIVGLHGGLEDEVGGTSGVIMYQCGYQWALQDMKRFSHRMRHEFGGGRTDIWQMNRRFVFETWWWPLNVKGFGDWKLDLQFEETGMTIVEVRNSAVAQAMEIVGKPACQLYAGLFAGAFAFFDKEDRAGIEVQCYAMGNDRCKFLISDERKVNAAEFWRQEGASATELIERLA